MKGEQDGSEADPFVIGLVRLGDDDIGVTVRGQTMRISDRDARALLDSLESWLYPAGRSNDGRKENA